MEKIYRLHYRAQLRERYTEEELRECVRACTDNIRSLQQEGRVLTAALYYCERMLFLYYEAMGEPLEIVEPLEAAKAIPDTGASWEIGEDVQITAVHPNEFLAPIAQYLMPWPGQQEDRLWVHMYHIYYHDIPSSKEYWRRAEVPKERKGRIAFVREDKVFSYVYHHKAIVDEGLLPGDKYQSIALHENILFSYFEEPKTLQNVRRTWGDIMDKIIPERSKAINEWVAVDPESHFIHMPKGKGENFMFLPALFALGVEDLRYRSDGDF